MNWNNLSSLAWLLGIGALFYWMMRKGGCGMHSGHSNGGGHQHGGGHGRESGGHAGHEPPGPQATRDPVCGMQIEPERAVATRNASGRSFYLCSAKCLEKFDRDPEGYARRALESETQTAGERTGHAGC